MCTILDLCHIISVALWLLIWELPFPGLETYCLPCTDSVSTENSATGAASTKSAVRYNPLDRLQQMNLFAVGNAWRKWLQETTHLPYLEIAYRTHVSHMLIMRLRCQSSASRV